MDMIHEHSYIPVDFDPFAGKEIEKIAITTEPQREIWFSCILGGNDANLAYNESVSLEFEGTFNFPAFRRAALYLIKRHEALRATVSTNGETLFIYTDFPFDIEMDDISQAGKEEQQEIIKEFLHREMNTPFNLQEGPLFRFFLHKLSDTLHHFTLFMHHIIGDGWSTGTLLEDLSKMYNACLKNESIQLPAAPQISTYAEEELIFKESDEYKVIESYWLNQYKENIPVLDLPTDYPRLSPRSYKSSRYDYPVDKEQVADLKSTGAKAGCSLVNTLLSAFEIFLYHETGQTDIIIGLPTAGQSATENFRLVGHCVNLLPLRSKVEPEISFIDYLKKRKDAFFDAYDNQRLTVGELVKKLNIKRDSTRIPLIPVVFNIDMYMGRSAVFDGLKYQLIFNPKEYEIFEIFLNATGSKGSLILEWSYNTNLFKPETIGKFITDFEHLLKEIIRNPEIKIKDISFNDSTFFSKLEKWNNTSVEYPKDKSLVSLIHEVAVQHPGKIAIEYKQQKISYKDLNEKSNQFAALLIQQGIETGQAIGLAVDRSPEMIIALLAIMKSGAAYIPLDPEYPKERIEYMLEDSNAKILITSKKYSQHFKTNATEIILEDSLSLLSQFSNEYPSINLNGSDLAYILYTSGSTGKPKGVQIEHHNLVNFLNSMKKLPGMTANDSLLAITTISFDIAGLELYLPLISGAKIVLADTETIKDGYKLLALIKEKKITILQATPSTWRMLLDCGWNKPFDFKALCGGEALPKDIADKLVVLCNSLWNMYGPTETTIWSTVKQITADSQPITIGSPIDNTQVYILDEYLKSIPIGATGEIFIAGEGVARGYFNKSDLTAERFLPNPYAKGINKIMYRTGDLGKFLENGEIQCLGRIDQQVKIRGHRIELGEIEYNLGKLAGIKEAVVVANEDQSGNQKLAAYVIPAHPDKSNNDRKEQKKWREAIGEILPHYMIPNDWIILNEFPLTPNNKIDKKALPKPQSDIHGFNRKIDRLPVTKIEKLIAKIWEEELGCRNISLDDNFFDLGGHSLIAVKMMNHLEKETGKRIPLTALFEGPTIEKLASLINKKEHKWDSFVPIKSSGNKIPIYLIHGVGLNVLIFSPLAKYLHPEQPIYGIQAKGLNGTDKLLDKMEEIAAHYIDEIMKQNPDGPYAIGGYSFGGLIALEMSKQLKAMGKKVILTCMFDSYAFKSFYHEPLYKKILIKSHEIFMRIVYALYFMTHEPKIVVTNKIRYAKIILRSLFEKLSVKKGISEDNFVGYSKRATQMYQAAFRNYKLTPYDGTIDVFRSKKQTYYMKDFKFLGWKPYALQGITVHEVPGYHLDMFTYPNVEEFAKILQARLDEVTSGFIEKD